MALTAILNVCHWLCRLKVKEKLRELGVDKQIHDLVTSKVIVQPTAAPKPGKLPVSREEAITQLKACLAPLHLPNPSGGTREEMDGSPRK